jgi:beta-glucosidase
MITQNDGTEFFAFPPGFLWGTATSSHQVEGGNNRNNWRKWEEEEHIIDGSRSGRACGWVEGRWREDLDRAAEAGQNAHRCSLEWSRLQPAPREWDEAAVRFYRELLEGMRDRGLRPLVTLHHFTEPAWFAAEGGWLGDDALRYFTVYVEGVMARLGDLCRDWCTLNEPNALVLQSHIFGSYPPGDKNIVRAFRAAARLAEAHAAAYRIIHSGQTDARVGIVILYYDIQPRHAQRKGNLRLVRLLSRIVNDFFADAAVFGRFPSALPFRSDRLRAGAMDFLGLNYYTGAQVGWSMRLWKQLGLTFRYPPGAPRSATGLVAHFPEGFRRALDWAAGFGIPVILTENGIDDAEDALRPRYIVDHLREASYAIMRGLPLEGYFHWSLVDNFEWEKGWTHRFGLWAMDTETLERTPRPSAALYADICRANGFNEEIARKHAALLAPARIIPQH